MTRFFTLLLALAGSALAQPIADSPHLDLRLPTENHHLFTGELDKFYMYVDRNFEGQHTKPFEGGKFGFVRTPIRVNGDVVLTKFHEGIDIAPVKRDTAGNPLDLVSSIADGTVIHISPLAGRSNYGKYAVVEHAWENSSVYSLYAHLSKITVNPGDPVKAGSVLGQMGFTGDGINRARSHVHLELAFLMSRHFDDWQKHNGGGINYQGNFNGMNLAGVAVSDFFLAHKNKPDLTFSQFIASVPVYFKVSVPANGPMDFVERYPWIVQGDPKDAVSWEIAFSATGHPIAFIPSPKPVVAPILSSIRPSPTPHRLLTRGLVIGEGNQASLSPNGHKLVSLVTGSFPKSAQ
jgi:murein DD-endopeptidase MepM/ murein hydrolase activator NlpD